MNYDNCQLLIINWGLRLCVGATLVVALGEIDAKLGEMRSLSLSKGAGIISKVFLPAGADMLSVTIREIRKILRIYMFV